ncbi:MAG: hypothetical protein LBF92_05285, partial [Synergistaceae bacterium]|nr:hypothetical protein [Synergistaceae bacterium]
RFINPSNPAQTLIKTPEIDVEFLERVNLSDQDNSLLSGNYINKRFANGDELKYQEIFDNPLDPSEIDHIFVHFGPAYAYSQDDVLYRWHFNADYDENAYVPVPGGDSGGGCNALGGAFAALALGAAALATRKRGQKG